MSATVLLPQVQAGVEALIGRTLEVDQRHPQAQRRAALTERDLNILHALAELRYLTTAMLAALAWGRYNSRLRDRLHTLFHAGLIDRFRPPTLPRNGGTPWIYRLNTPGYRALKHHHPDTCPPWTPTDLHAFSYAEHDVELNALLCEIAARAAARTATTGPLLHAAPFRILGPRSGRIDPDHDARPRNADPVDALPAGQIVRPGSSYRGPLEPDATLLGHRADTGQPIAVLIEYDRTRRGTKLTGKLDRYDHFLTAGWRQTRYATHPDEPTVLFITQTDEHLPNVLREADRHLTAWTGPHGQPKQRGHYPGREELGVTSRQRLIAGDDTILQVPPRPPNPPAASIAPAATIQTRLPLDRLFTARRDEQP